MAVPGSVADPGTHCPDRGDPAASGRFELAGAERARESTRRHGTRATSDRCPTNDGRPVCCARDGHYAAALTFFLGQFARNPAEFAIKLDTDVKAEKEEKNNLILVGGPGTNLLTQEINDYLPVRFNMQSSNQGFLLGGMVSQKTQRTFTADTAGLVAKIVNPWDETKRIIVVAGNKAVGTKACVLALTNFWSKTLQNYHDGEPFGAVIQGFDLDGDGKVDAIEVPE